MPTHYAAVCLKLSNPDMTSTFDLLRQKLTHRLLLPWRTYTSSFFLSLCLFDFELQASTKQTDRQTDEKTNGCNAAYSDRKKGEISLTIISRELLSAYGAVDAECDEHQKEYDRPSDGAWQSSNSFRIDDEHQAWTYTQYTRPDVSAHAVYRTTIKLAVIVRTRVTLKEGSIRRPISISYIHRNWCKTTA